MLVLGALVMGGIGLASMVSDTPGSGAALRGRAGGILGSGPGATPGATIYNIPPGAGVTFPDPPKFDITKLFDPAPEAPGVTPEGAPSKKTQKMYEGLPVPEHYPTDILAYAGAQHDPEAFLKGLTQEQANIAYLARHPTLKLSESGEIVPRSKKGALTPKGESVKEKVAEREKIILTTAEVGVTTPGKIASQRASMATRGSGGRGYPDMSKKEVVSLSATKERLAAT